MRDFHELKVWAKGHELALDVYGASRCFPREEVYGLTSQLRRAATSVPTNIAEGCGRNSRTDMARFFQIALGSASETEYLLLLGRDLGYLPDQDHEMLTAKVIEIKRMLSAFLQTLRADG